MLNLEMMSKFFSVIWNPKCERRFKLTQFLTRHKPDHDFFAENSIKIITGIFPHTKITILYLLLSDICSR